MVTKGGNWNGQKSFLKNLPVKAAANGANTSRSKECNIDGQHRHLRCEIITALHTHHQNSNHLQRLFYNKLGIMVCV